jgi:cytochrome c2
MIAMTPRSTRPPKLCLAVALWSLASQAVAQTPDPGTGRQVFQTQCSICHTIQPNQSKIGPTLFGVVNRPAGQVAGFHYSEANKHSGLTWDPATLDRYLAAPRQVVPGTFMTFPGLKDPTLRADVIAFLETLH